MNYQAPKKLSAILLILSIFISFIPLSVHAATPIVATNISLEKTGSEPFNTSTGNDDCSETVTWDTARTFSDGSAINDGNHGAGNDGQDGCSDNDVVRLGDSVTYKVEVSVNDSDVDELFSTVSLDPYDQATQLPSASGTIHQEWIEIPSGCETDLTIVSTPSALQDLDSDGYNETLFCSLGFAQEGTNKVFFPASQVIGTSTDSTKPTLNDSIVGASVASYGDSNTALTGNNGVSTVATSGPVEAIVTANFRVNLRKEMVGFGYDADGNEIWPQLIEKKGSDGTTDGYLAYYDIIAEYQKGSMIANSDDELVDTDSDTFFYDADYDVIDIFTDDNTNNDAGGISSNAELYSWDTSLPACSFNGDHGVGATFTCTQTDYPIDWTGPSFTPDIVNDMNIHIDLDNIDTRDPDGDGTLFNVRVGIWIPESDVDNHQTCDVGPCTLFHINEAQSLDTSTNTPADFSPISTEDASGNNLDNYGAGSEPGGVASPDLHTTNSDNLTNGLLEVGSPGGWSYRKTFRRTTSNTTNTPKIAEQLTAKNEVIPFILIAYDYRLVDGAKSQVCDKIDTTQYEFAGVPVWDKYPLYPSPKGPFFINYYDGSPSSYPRETQNNPSMRIWGGTQSTAVNLFSDAESVTKTLYSAVPNGSGSLKDLDEVLCEDDVNEDSSIVIMDSAGNLVDENGNATTGAVDWYEDFTMVPDAPDGTSGVTKVRFEYTYDHDFTTAEYESFGGSGHKNTSASQMYDLRVRSDATGYGAKNYMPNFVDARRTVTTDNSSWLAWQDNTTDDIHDPTNVSFGHNIFSADRNVLVPSGISIGKNTIPEGLKVVRGGDIVQFELSPTLLGLWAGSQEATVNDNLPAGTTYIVGSEEFSTDGGTTWLSHADYNASSPDINLTSAIIPNAQDPIIWTFSGIESGEQMPLIRYKVLVDPNLTSGNFTNTVTFSSPNIAADIYITDTDDDGVPDTGDGVGDDVEASYKLTILPNFGFDVLKSVSKEVYSTNEAFDFNLIYKNLGGEAYSGGRFIDILPFDGDATVGIGGINSDREPATDFTGTYDLTRIVTRNSETVYVTDEDPSTLNLDPCASSNVASGYVPQNPEVSGLFIDQLCYQDYVNNGNQFPDGVSTGTASANWQVCTGGATKTVSAHCPIGSADVTAVRFDAATVPTSGGQIVTLTLDPTGNIGGEPVYTTSPSGLQEVDFDNSPNVGDKYTNSFGGRIPEVSLNVISNDVTVTVVSGSIGNYVWYDLNGDGIQDDGEPALEGVVVNLLDSSGQPVYIDPVTGGIVDATSSGAIIYTATTDANGEYLFEGIPAGDYTVSIDSDSLPSGAEATSDSDGIGTLNTSDLTLGFETDSLGNITGVDDNDTQDFGYFYTPQGSIGNYIWNDVNMDGIQDNDEEGFSGVTVNILDDTGNPVFIDPFTQQVVPAGTTGAIPYTTTTDSNGEYLFENLPQGTYTVEIDVSTLPDDIFQTFDSDGVATSNSSSHTLLPITNSDGVITDLVDNDTQDFGYFIAAPTWELRKGTESTPMKAGDTLDYTFELENTGNVNISSITLTDDKCASGPTLNATSDEGSDNILSPDETWEYTCTSIAVTQDEADDGEVYNKATAAGTPVGGDLEDAESEITKPVGATPAIKLYKAIASVVDTTGDSLTGSGDTVNYSFTVQNTGNVTLTDITVTDTSLDGLVLSGATISTLAPNELNSTSYTASYVLTQADVDRGGVENVANVSGTDPNNTIVTDISDTTTNPNLSVIQNPDGTETGNPFGDNENDTGDSTDDPTTYTITPTPSVSVYKSVSSIVDTTGDSLTGSGDTVNYSFTVQNTGNVTLTDITVTDTSLDGLVLSGATIATLAPNEIDSTSYTASYVLTQEDVDRGGVENTANVSGTDPNSTVINNTSDAGTNPDLSIVDNPNETETDSPLGDSSNNTSDPTDDPTTYSVIPTPAWNIVKTTDSLPTEQGETLDYIFTVENTGNVTISNPVITDDKCSAAPSLDATTDINSDSKLTPGEVWKYSCTSIPVTLQEVDDGQVDNTVTASGTSPGNIQDTSHTISVPVGENPRLQVYKTIIDEDNRILTLDEDVITYSFTIENTGNVTITDVKLIDLKLGGDITSSCDFPISGTTTLEPEQVAECEHDYAYTQDDIDNGYVENSAQAEGLSPNDTIVTDTSDAGDDTIETPDVVGATDDDAGNDPTHISIVVGFGSTRGGGGGGSGSSSSSSSGNPVVSEPEVIIPEPEPIIEVEEESIPEVETPTEEPSEEELEVAEEETEIDTTPNTDTIDTLKSKHDRDIAERVRVYEEQIKLFEELSVDIKGESLLKALPKELPRTGTPISERVPTNPSSIVDTELPDASVFRLAGDTNTEISHWTQVLVEEDRNANKYVVVPSNGLVIPINEFAEDSSDFDTMINGREGNIMPALRTGALEYPGTSTKGYGEVGNKVVFAHSSYFANEAGRYKTHFQKIIELDRGEEVWVYEKQSDGTYERFAYEVDASYNTDDEDTSVLLPGEGKNLTLFTCTPIGGIEGRWIIKAKYIEDEISVTPVSIPQVSQRYKLAIRKFISRIESIDDETKRLETLYVVYDRLEMLKTKYTSNTKMMDLLEYMQYKIAKSILAQ